MNNRAQEVWDSLANSEKLIALLTVLAASAKKHPFLGCVVGSVVVCNIIPLLCFFCYSLIAGVFIFSVAAVVQCKTFINLVSLIA